jgi:hypothetical protein
MVKVRFHNSKTQTIFNKICSIGGQRVCSLQIIIHFKLSTMAILDSRISSLTTTTSD